MTLSRRSFFRLSAAVVILSGTCTVQADIPKPLKSRLIVGDPVWRELPVRDGLRNGYDKLWELAVNTVLENNFDIATMDKDSGYVRTAWNEGVVALGGSWFYKVQVSLKFVVESAGGGRNVSKIRLQAAGEVSKVTAKGLKEYYRGYDQVILQNLFQDLQSKLGSI